MKTFFFLTIFLCLTVLSMKAQPLTLKLWPDKIPGILPTAGYQENSEKNDILWITKVTDPTITVYRPAADKATGTAVVICPGGGYGGLAYDYEGIEIASYFNSIGITGIVLKYRLPSDLIMQNKTIGPLQDAQEAIRIVRRNAKKWKLDPHKIGIMGFSAGGHLASTASTHYLQKVYEPIDTTSARPDFSILIYPVVTMQDDFTHQGSKENLLGKNAGKTLTDLFSNELQVTKDTPPAFLAHALDDDAVPVQNSIQYLLALKKCGVTGELHIYEKGGHGFSIRNTKGTETHWPEALKSWLTVKGLF